MNVFTQKVTKREIINAVRDLYIDGVDWIDVPKIAAHIGCSASTVYRVFREHKGYIAGVEERSNPAGRGSFYHPARFVLRDHIRSLRLERTPSAECAERTQRECEVCGGRGVV